MKQEDNTDIRISVRLNDDEWRRFHKFKVLSGVEDSSSAFKLALDLASEYVILRQGSGKWKFRFEKITADDLRRMAEEPPRKTPKSQPAKTDKEGEV